MLLIGVAIRLVASKINFAYDSDIDCFKFWSNRLATVGFAGFYDSEVFTDYPPGYMYVLYLIGKIRIALGISYSGETSTFLIKLPAMICDILTGLLLYKISYQKMKPTLAWIISFAYLINPAVIINSVVWGQVDAVYTLVVLASVYYIAKKSYLPSFILFAVAILIKPQAFIFTPVYLFASYEFLSENKFSKDSVIQFLKYCAPSAFVLLLGILPFSQGFDFSPVINQYIKTLGSYPYATLNAYNFYAFTGGMWKELSVSFMMVPYYVWGTVFLNIIVILSLYLLNRNHVKSNYFFIAGLINAMTFMFSVKMHERYLFPSLVFFLVAYIYKREKKFLLLYGGFSLTLFVNCADVLNMYHNENSLKYLQNSFPLLSMLNLVLTAFQLYTAFSSYKIDQPEEELHVDNPKPYNNPDFQIAYSRPLPKMGKKDYVLVAALMLSIASFLC